MACCYSFLECCSVFSILFHGWLLFLIFFKCCKPLLYPQNNVVIFSWYLNILCLQVAEKTALLRPIELKLVPVALEGSAFRSKFLDTDELMNYCGWFAVRSNKNCSLIVPWEWKLLDWSKLECSCILDSCALCSSLSPSLSLSLSFQRRFFRGLNQ